MIARSILNVAEVDYIAKAPDGKEVEDLTRKEIIKSMRTRIPVDQYKGLGTSGGGPNQRFQQRPEQSQRAYRQQQAPQQQQRPEQRQQEAQGPRLSSRPRHGPSSASGPAARRRDQSSSLARRYHWLMMTNRSQR